MTDRDDLDSRFALTEDGGLWTDAPEQDDADRYRVSCSCGWSTICVDGATKPKGLILNESPRAAAGDHLAEMAARTPGIEHDVEIELVSDRGGRGDR